MLSRSRTDGSSYCAAGLPGVANVCSRLVPKPSARTNARRSALLQRTITRSATVGFRLEPVSSSASGMCPPRQGVESWRVSDPALARWPKISSFTVASDAKIRESQRSEEHTSELQSLAYLVCRLLL